MRPVLFAAIATLLVPSMALASYKVSSTKKDSGREDRWGVANALDSDKSTCWQVDPESEQKGEWIEIGVPASEVDKVKLMVGWNQNKTTFTDYARIKSVRVEVYTDDGEKRVLEHTANLEDKMGYQEIDLPDTAVGGEMSGGKVRLIVTDIYPGQDYPNLAVSEVAIVLKEKFDADATMTSPPPAIEGREAEKMIDGSTKTYWSSPPGQKSAEFTISPTDTGFGLSSIGILPGPSNVARPKKIEVSVANTTTVYELQNTSKMQFFTLPTIVGYTGSAWGDVGIKILETHESSSDSVGIAEIKLKATIYSAL